MLIRVLIRELIRDRKNDGSGAMAGITCWFVCCGRDDVMREGQTAMNDERKRWDADSCVAASSCIWLFSVSQVHDWHWETPMVFDVVAFLGSLYLCIPTHSSCIPNSLHLYIVSFLYSSLFLLSIPTYSCIDCPVSLRWWCWQTPIMFKGARADDEVSFFNTNATPLICSSTPTYISTLFCSVLLCILINFILLNSD